MNKFVVGLAHYLGLIDKQALNKTPCACFKVALASASGVGDELARILERHLRGRIDSVELPRKRLWRFWFVGVQVSRKRFTVLLAPSRYGNDEWILLVARLSTPTLWDRLRGRRPIDYAPELLRISSEIHTLLAATSGITAIRWYFEGRGAQSAAVHTPDQLPWTH